MTIECGRLFTNLGATIAAALAGGMARSAINKMHTPDGASLMFGAAAIGAFAMVLAIFGSSE